jgi:hypothetical protein
MGKTCAAAAIAFAADGDDNCIVGAHQDVENPVCSRDMRDWGREPLEIEPKSCVA